MNDLALDNNGDLLVRNFDLTIYDGIDSIIQNVAIRLRFFLEEWFLDTDVGIPYYQDFFIKSPNRIRIESLIKQEILDTEGVNEITFFSSTFQDPTRQFIVQFSANTNLGEFNLEVSVP